MGVQIRLLRDEYAAQTIMMAYDLVGQNPIVEKAARPGKGRKLQGLKSGSRLVSADNAYRRLSRNRSHMHTS